MTSWAHELYLDLSYSPRDAVTISRSFNDASTVIDISTSLPRSPDEPSYLRPAPPYVRSNVACQSRNVFLSTPANIFRLVFAWCIQLLQPPQQPLSASPDQPKRKPGRVRITCFWQHDLRSVWNIGTSSGIVQQLSTMVLGLLKTVIKRSSRVPTLTGYGNGITIERMRFQIDREALTIDYAIIPEDEDHTTEHLQGLNELHAKREQRRLTRSIECVLPSSEGWDVQVSTKASSEEVEKLPWTTHAIRSSSYQSSPSPPDQITLRLSHAPLLDDHSILKVSVVIEISGPSSGLRLNGVPQAIRDIEERDPTSYTMSQQILQDMSSTTDLSFDTSSFSNTTAASVASTASTSTLVRPPAERSTAAEKSILSRVKRNYIYFSSLLQEPEAKWKRSRCSSYSGGANADLPR